MKIYSNHSLQLHLMKQNLLAFWKEFGGRNNYGKGFTEEEKLLALQLLANHVYFRRTTSLVRYRRRFNKKYQSQFNYPCFVCYGNSEHRHHIIPLKNGGLNAHKNRITLCKSCHEKIHPWMVKGRGADYPSTLERGVANNAAPTIQAHPDASSTL